MCKDPSGCVLMATTAAAKRTSLVGLLRSTPRNQAIGQKWSGVSSSAQPGHPCRNLGIRRRYSGSGAPAAPAGGGFDPKQEKEGHRFIVTGSLLDARRAGSDSPVPGQFLSVSHTFGPEAVAAFAAHAGDDNPIHLDEEYARRAG